MKHLLKISKKKMLQFSDSPRFDWLDNYYKDDKNGITYASRWPIILFFFSAIFCLISSGTFHLLYEHSEKFYSIFLQLDIAGVNFLIFGSCVPLIYYGFFCYPVLIIVYLLLSSISNLSVCLLNAIIDLKANAKLKVFFFVLSSCSSIFPFAHLLYNQTFNTEYDSFEF